MQPEKHKINVMHNNTDNIFFTESPPLIYYIIFHFKSKFVQYKSALFTDTNSVICKIIVGADAYIRPRVDVGIDPYEMFGRNCRGGRLHLPVGRCASIVPYGVCREIATGINALAMTT